MKHMKKILSLMLAIVLCIGVFSGCGTTSDESQVVATVGEEVITAGELKYAIEVVKMQSVGQLQGEDVEEFWSTEKDGKDAETYIREKALDLLIDIAVMAQAAKDNNLTVTAEEVNEEYKTNQESYKQTLETYGVSEASFKEILRKQMLYSKYGERVLATSERFNPSDEQLKQFFADNFYKAQHILKMTVDQATGEPLAQTDKDAKKAEIDGLLQKAKGGADFKALMAEHSEDPGKEQSPDGYVFTEGEMVPEFYEGTKALEENGISDVIESSYGYHIIKRVPLDLEADFQAYIGNIQTTFMVAEEEKVAAELLANTEVTQDDVKIQAIPVRESK